MRTDATTGGTDVGDGRGVLSRDYPGRALSRLGRRGVISDVADRAQPVMRRALD